MPTPASPASESSPSAQCALQPQTVPVTTAFQLLASRCCPVRQDHTNQVLRSVPPGYSMGTVSWIWHAGLVEWSLNGQTKPAAAFQRTARQSPLNFFRNASPPGSAPKECLSQVPHLILPHEAYEIVDRGKLDPLFVAMGNCSIPLSA